MTASAPAPATAATKRAASGSSSEKISVLRVTYPLDVVAVEVVEDLWQLVEAEVGGAMAGVEVAEAEVDSVGAVGDGGAQALPVARRGQ
jgi:hypothetical protein